MRRLILLLAVPFALSCTDSDVQPTSPDAPAIRADHTPTSGADLCGGQSPCDAQTAGHPGVWFLPPFMNNGSPFSGPFVSGLEEIVDVVVCEINTGYPPDPPSDIDTGGQCEKLDTTEDTAGKHYRASIRFRRPDVGMMFRVHVVIGEVHLAFRDIIIDPNDTSPASDALLSVGTGNNPIKVRIDDGFGFNCDESQGEINCLITNAGGNITLNNGNVTLNVGPGNGANLFTAQTSACSQLGVDNTLFGCMVSIESGTLGQQQLTATELIICEAITTPGSTVAYVIQDDAAGQAVLTPRAANCPAASANGFPGLLRSGLGKLASLFGAEPLIATSALGPLSGGGGSVRRLSDFQLGLMSVADKLSGDGATLRAGDAVEAVVSVENAGNRIAGTRIHFFPDADGTAVCPAALANGASCDHSGAVWDHTVFVTGDNGEATVSWTPGGTGIRELKALGCGVARPGGSGTPTTDPGNGVLGLLQTCDRDPTLAAENGFDNGPVAGDDPFEPFGGLDVALNDLPLTFTATVCDPLSTPSDINGVRDGAWNCAESEDFIANLSGGNSAPATVFWMNDADNLYLAVFVERDSDAKTTSLSFEFDNVTDPSTHPNDDLLFLDVSNKTADTGDFSDMHLTSGCASSSGSSLCGDVDTFKEGEGAVEFDGAGGGLFYEISHPLCSEDAEDFCVSSGDDIGFFLRLQQGKGGQGGTIWQALRDYFQITIQ